jgi:hypothetical protein
MHQSRFSVLVILAIALAIPTAARSVTLQVANTGADGPSCGSVATPCRSIGNAVANAVPNDTILVGPGIYSADLDKDGVQSEPGEEPVILTIDKAVKVLSSFGASSTVIEGVDVDIEASNVVFGKLNGGFTIATTNNPLLILGATPSLANVRVAGNVIVEDDPQGAAAVIVFQAGGRFENNRVVSQRGCSSGFFLLDVPAKAVVTGELRHGVHERIPRAGCWRCPLGRQYGRRERLRRPRRHRLRPAGSVAEFSGNVAIGNGTGVRVTSPIPIFQKTRSAGASRTVA